MLIDRRRVCGDFGPVSVPSKAIRVAIVEDDPSIRGGLHWLVNNSPEFDCVLACGSGEEALEEIPKKKPDIILLDIHLPRLSGIDCLPRLKASCPNTQISMLTVFEDEDMIYRSLMAGATGYLLKKTPPAAILEAIKDLHAGGSPMSSQIARKLVQAFVGKATAMEPSPTEATSEEATSTLCAREREILDFLAQGYRYKEIADKLGITIHTVRTFIRRMYEKLHVHSRTEALNKVRGL